MNILSSISRAILTLVLASALLAMSLASGLHELTHALDHGRVSEMMASACNIGPLHRGPTLGRFTFGHSHATPEIGASIDDFCFFCTHGASFAFAPAFRSSITLVQIDSRHRTAVFDPVVRRAGIASPPRAPPFTA